MKHYFVITYCLVSFFFISCGKDNSKIEKVKPLKPTVVKEITSQKTTDSNIVNHSTATIEKAQNTIAKSEKNINTEAVLPTKKQKTTTLSNKKHYASFAYFRKMLDASNPGETLTQKELSENHNIPEDAIKLIKSITKISNNEIAIKWHSTWMVEKISDAKFENATMKIRFDKNKMYTSGKAIGIKYNKKTYNDLIIIGTSAYIPSVKGYHWKIGK